MSNFKYKCKDEAKQFLFLCGEKDRKILLSRKKTLDRPDLLVKHLFVSF